LVVSVFGFFVCFGVAVLGVPGFFVGGVGVCWGLVFVCVLLLVGVWGGGVLWVCGCWDTGRPRNLLWCFVLSRLLYMLPLLLRLLSLFGA